MLPLSAAPHFSPTTSNSLLPSQSVSKLLVIIPDALPHPTCMTLWTVSPSQLSSTDLHLNFLLTAPHTPTPLPNKLGIVLQPDFLIYMRSIDKTTEEHSAVISSPTVAVFFRIFHCCYLYSLLFHFCHCINIYTYSTWSGEQFCNWSSNILYVLSWQYMFQKNSPLEFLTCCYWMMQNI